MVERLLRIEKLNQALADKKRRNAAKISHLANELQDIQRTVDQVSQKLDCFDHLALLFEDVAFNRLLWLQRRSAELADALKADKKLQFDLEVKIKLCETHQSKIKAEMDRKVRAEELERILETLQCGGDA